MCNKRLESSLCWDYRCPHNLFWEKLNLDTDKIQVTKRAFEIRNCCCLIGKPWTGEEIKAVWGLPMEEILRSEAGACKKLGKSRLREESAEAIFSALNSSSPPAVGRLLA